jgi:hypothetical protein
MSNEIRPIVLKFEFSDEFGSVTKMEKQFDEYWADSQLETMLEECANFLRACGFDYITSIHVETANNLLGKTFGSDSSND